MEDLFGFVVVMLAISTPFLIARFMRLHFRDRAERRKMGGSHAARELFDENAMLRDEIDALRERVEILERVVTDDGYALGQELKSL